MAFWRKWLVVIVALCLICAAAGSGLAGSPPDGTAAKYVFLFIGDGMGVVQRHAAELYLSAQKGASHPGSVKLVMNTFPAQGMTTIHDLTSVIPDSASTATAIASGHKTKAGVIGMDADARLSYESIAETAKKANWKVGILTTVSLDHATPAAFYAHVPSRSQMYAISLQLANSGMDYFAGGQLIQPVDPKDPGKVNALEVARKNGYTVAVGRAAFEALKPGIGKVIAMSAVVDRDAAMYFSLDQGSDPNHVSIAEYLAKGIDLLDNPNGFFIMVEGGKIDWACHAHDAAASIHDVLALDEAIAQAVDFFRKHPKDTLIIVTGDHETGGMSIGFAGTHDLSFVDKIQHQKMSYVEFNRKLADYKQVRSAPNARLEDLLPLIREAFGLFVMSADERALLEKAVSAGRAKRASREARIAARQAQQKLKYGMALSELELNILRAAFKESMLRENDRARGEYAYLQYGGYEPLTVKLTTILSNKAGIGWTTYSHTGAPVQTSALGAGAELFNGCYDQTEIYAKIMAITGLGKSEEVRPQQVNG
jgi:alkaline phosphatase